MAWYERILNVIRLARLMTKMLFGVSPADAATLTGGAGIVTALSAASSLVPAIRAARVEPMQALREE